MKYTLFLTFLLLGFSGVAQTVEKEKLSFPDFNWTITIPEGFERVDDKDWGKIQSRGEAAIEDTYGEEVINQTEVIFVYRSGELNFIEANHQPYDPTLFETYEASCRELYGLLYETFSVQMPDARLDTLISTEVIDGLEFQKFEIVIHYPNDLQLTAFMYNYLFDDRDFSLNIMYVEEPKGQQMLGSWKNCSFKKE